ncbi:hypothetical protein [Streptomyces sp. NPDC001135]
MGTFVTVSVLFAVIVFGVIVIQLFTASHDDRMETLTSGRTRRWRFSPWHRTGKSTRSKGGSRSRPRR